MNCRVCFCACNSAVATTPSHLYNFQGTTSLEHPCKHCGTECAIKAVCAGLWDISCSSMTAACESDFRTNQSHPQVDDGTHNVGVSGENKRQLKGVH
ncbi:unnamed protein product [Sphagnum jensenii]|uniref:TNFR-Cys domain-containing protein n=1 Tax=Sphagnum jensenii TaxID=128206 RepID=A0ABP1BBQ4_9BRYO